MTWAPDLETLDQLLGGDLSLTIIRGLFEDDQRFTRAMLAMLDARELRLLAPDGDDVPKWRRQAVLASTTNGEPVDVYKISITDSAARRMA